MIFVYDCLLPVRTERMYVRTIFGALPARPSSFALHYVHVYSVLYFWKNTLSLAFSKEKEKRSDYPQKTNPPKPEPRKPKKSLLLNEAPAWQSEPLFLSKPNRTRPPSPPDGSESESREGQARTRSGPAIKQKPLPTAQ